MATVTVSSNSMMTYGVQPRANIDDESDHKPAHYFCSATGLSRLGR
jgi:hypothetical protein